MSVKTGELGQYGLVFFEDQSVSGQLIAGSALGPGGIEAVKPGGNVFPDPAPGGRHVELMAGHGVLQHGRQGSQTGIIDENELMDTVTFQQRQKTAEGVIAGYGKEIVPVEQVAEII